MSTGGLSRWDWHRAAPGYGFYLPEPVYFSRDRDPSGALLRQASQVTARCLARWSDWFRASPSYYQDPSREGALPETPDAREQFIGELFAWFAESNPEGFTAGMILRAGQRWALGAHDGFPGDLHLRADEFVELQDRLEAANLPRDLYYPILEQRDVVEPFRTR